MSGPVQAARWLDPVPVCRGCGVVYGGWTIGGAPDRCFCGGPLVSVDRVTMTTDSDWHLKCPRCLNWSPPVRFQVARGCPVCPWPHRSAVERRAVVVDFARPTTDDETTLGAGALLDLVAARRRCRCGATVWHYRKPGRVADQWATLDHEGPHGCDG